jgi:hypothetical protein
MTVYINGRPDFKDHRFGITEIRQYPQFIYSLSRNAMLVHKVVKVEAHWYEAEYDRLRRLETPRIIATAVCGQGFFVYLPDSRRKSRSSFCEIPKKDSVPCGACHGCPRPFGKHGYPPCSKEMARVRLGCIVRGRKTSETQAVSA